MMITSESDTDRLISSGSDDNIDKGVVTSIDDTESDDKSGGEDTLEETSSVSRPISGDVTALLQEMDSREGVSFDDHNHAPPTTKCSHHSVDGVPKELTALKAALPEGTRPATEAEIANRRLPPGSTAILIPSGQTLKKALLDRCIEFGLFPITSPGVPFLEMIDAEDREQMQRLLEEAMTDTKRITTHPGALGMSTEAVEIEKIPVGPSGYRIPEREEVEEEEETMVDWEEGEQYEELKQSFQNASFINALKLLVISLGVMLMIGAIGLYAFWQCGFKLSIFSIFLLAGWALYIELVVRKVAAGYQCPTDYLEIPQPEKIAVVTGGAAGIGGEIVKQLFKQGCAKIFVLEKSYMLACQLLSERKRELDREEVSVSDWNTVVEAITCDISDLNEVFEFTKSLAARKLPIHFLVMNHSEFHDDRPTNTTLDKNFVGNYLGHFLLAKQLFIPLNHVNGRVISTGSQFYAVAKNLDFHDNILQENLATFKSANSYFSSKACQLLFTKMLAQMMLKFTKKDCHSSNAKASAFSYNPGIILDPPMKKLLKSSNHLLSPILVGLFKLIGKTPKDGAQSAFKLLFAPMETLRTGGFYNEGTFQKTYSACNINKQAVKENIVKLWQMSNILVYDYTFDKRMRDGFSLMRKSDEEDDKSKTGIQSPSVQAAPILAGGSPTGGSPLLTATETSVS